MEWLAQSPRHWTCAPAWSVFSERGEKSSPYDVHLTPSQSHGVLPQSAYMEKTGSRVVLNLAGADNMKAVRKGDFIIHLRSFQGGLEASYLDGKVSMAYTVLKPAQDIHNGYFRYLMKSRIFVEQLNNLTDQLRDGQTINYARFSRMAIPLPPLDTQRGIADYLDRETGEIDAMIAKMDELAQTLEMRRGRAVDALLDDLPASTEWIPSKFVVKIRTGSGDTKDAVEHGEYPFYVRSQTPKSHDRWEFDGDAVLTAGDGAGVGKVFHFVTGKFMAHQRVYVINDFDGVVPKYYFHLFKHLFPKVATDGTAKATVDSVRHRMIADLRIPFPAPTEQRRIADHLDEVTGKIDAMQAKVAELKSLLMERRAALITDVVTGRKVVA